jgi:glutamate N-acetyltransferase/amino-acid N-acetyltransferase
MMISIQNVSILHDGMPVEFDRFAVHSLLKADTVKIAIDLQDGEFEATAWGCDLSKMYVDINAEYGT